MIDSDHSKDVPEQVRNARYSAPNQLTLQFEHAICSKAVDHSELVKTQQNQSVILGTSFFRRFREAYLALLRSTGLAESTVLCGFRSLGATYQVKLAEAQTPEQKADVVNWTINYLATGIYPNLRIDQLASAQADLKAQSSEAK